MVKSLADIAPEDIIWDDVQPPASSQTDWLTSAPRVSLDSVDPADIDWWGMGRWRDRTLMESAQKTIGEAGNAVRRGLAMSRLAREMEQPSPDANKIIEIQREIAQNPPSTAFAAAMNDKLTPAESWAAFTSNPVGVVNELVLDSLASFGSQMIEKAPARVAIGTGAGVAIGAPVFGVGAIPAGATGALAGFAQSVGAASYSLEMSGGILESLEKAGVNMGNPEELAAALQDEQRMKVAREFAEKKAIPVAAFDTVSALIGGRLLGAKPATVLSKLGKGAVETAIQSFLGMGGEAAGQLSQSGEITSVRQIAAEGVGEVGPGAVQVGFGTGMQMLQRGQQPTGATATAAPAPAAAPQSAPFTPPPAAETVVVEEVFGDATTAAAPVEEAAPAAEPAINPDDFEVVEMPGETIVTEPPVAPYSVLRTLSPDVAKSELEAIRAGDSGSKNEGKPATEPTPSQDYVETLVPIADIEFDRSTVDEKRVEKYAAQEITTPVHVQRNKRGDSNKFFVMDGGHRIAAAMDRGDTVIPALVPKPDVATQRPAAQPAAPRKIFRGVSPDVDYSSGDQFWSESREVAENYAAQTGTEGTIDETTPDALPQNLYTTTDKPTLKDELDLKSEPFAPEFDAEAKSVLQARGFEGIRYESGTDLGGEQATEFHVFGKAQQPAAQPAAAKKPKGRSYVPMAEFIENAGEELNEVLANAYTDMEINEDRTGLVGYADPRNAMYRGRISVREFFDWLHSDEPTQGMAPDAEYEALINRLREISLRPEKKKPTRATQQPAAQPAAAATPSFAEDLPQAKAVKDARGRSVVITNAAAKKMSDEKVMTSYAVFADTMLRAREAGQDIDPVVRVNAATVYQEGRRRNLVPQEPSIEAYLGTQPQDTPAQRSRRRIKNMTAQSGAIDLSIVEDLVEYGKTIYRAGMTYAQWAAAMVKEFGQAVAEFLQQAFNRVVEAYQNSRFSDTTGAVGDVRPKGKPRQFEQKAAQSPGLDAETRAQMGDDNYVPITLRGVAEQAKAWLAENGVEAAERRILELNSDDITPTPLDFALGLEVAANLSATGQHARAAAVVRTMSRRATSLGQTISTLAMLSRLTPEGIVFYANQIIEQYIGTLPPERQQQIRTAQDGIRQLETDIATTRKRTAEDTIIKGEQGGEKIQDKLKRRIPDKTQKQQTNVSIRSVLTSQATKAEATKQITQILVDNGISQSEATAMATAITNRFYKVLEDARKAAAANRRPASGKGRVTFDKLMAQLKDGKISDQEFIGALAQLVNVPALTPELRAKLERLTREYKAATDDDIALVTAARIFEEVHGLIPADFWVKLRAVSYLSMLFSPKTWIRNLGGNQIQWLADIGIDSAISMVFDPIASIFTGKRSTAGVYVGTRIKALLTPIQDVIKGYKWNAKQNPSASVMDNLKAGVEHLRVLAKLTTQNKFDIVDAKEVGRRIFSNKFMQMWEGALSIALGGGDRAFWMSAFRASLARREAAAKKNGEWTGQPTPEDVDAAYADAMYAIYQNPNVISKSTNRIRQALNRLSTFGKTDQFGLGTGLLAFTQVPGSLSLRGIIEMSPLGLVTALYEAMRPVLFKASGGRAGGQFRQEDFNKALSRAMVGSGMFYAGGYWLYSLGIVTASREEDDDLEAMRRASGMGAYRINVSALKRMLGSGNFFERQTPQDGDLIVPYDWAQPVAITFAAGAELAKQVEENNREGVKKGLAGKANMVAISLAAGAKSLEELPLLSGLSSFARTWGYSDFITAAYGTIAGMPSMFVPQLVRQANQLMDNTVRETRSGEGMFRAFNQIAANTPFVADQFPPRMDIMGQAIERYQYGGNSVFNVLISPAMATRVRTNPVLNEVARLMEATGETRQIPKQVKRSANINGESIQLSNEQLSAYQYYLGNYTMSMMNWRMASPRYARLPDTEKVRIFAQDIEDVDAAVKSALFGHDFRRLTRRQRVMRNNLVNSPLGQSMPPR